MKPTVVVGYDRSPSSERALTEAGREAAWRGATVSVVHAFHYVSAPSPMFYVPTDLEVALKDAAEGAATEGMNLLRDRYPGMTVDSEVIAGPAADGIAEAARDADLLVLGNRGRGGFAGLLLGSVSLRALGHARCPTMIVRGTPREPLGTIVLALDAEDSAAELLECAFAEASRRDARLRVVNAWDLDWGSAARAELDDEVERAKARAMAEVETALEELLAPYRDKYPGVRVNAEVVAGTPGAVLTEATTHADLAVVGAHRRGDGHPGMRLGPVTQTLLHHADCPVVVVPMGRRVHRTRV
ncbi:universal stress protein [Catenulispora subtropica]|uniref:Universal stress protein n=1 Tax=Catenulispora subtropica TaxID=450798 RepID=A0ABN2TH39_9ACTN